jgi:hypothetical protein
MSGIASHTYKCGKEIELNEIDFSNKCNEEGEDYYEFNFKCFKCGLELEGSGWGDVSDKHGTGTTSTEELIEEVHDKIHKYQ